MLGAVTAGTGALAVAQAQVWSDRSGIYEHQGSAAERIGDAIDEATADMNVVRRRLARKKLDEANHAYQEFRVHFGDEVVRMLINDAVLALPHDASAVAARGPEGRSVRASQKLEGDTLVQRFRGKRGTRIHRFRWMGDGTVRLTVRIESKHLPEPVTYRLRYRRSS